MYKNKMRKDEIITIADHLKAFAIADHNTPAIQQLPEPFFFPKARRGTRMELMWRIILECHDTLQRGDREGFVPHPRYTMKDVLAAQKGINTLERIIQSPGKSNDKDIKSVHSLLNALDGMLTLYLDKAVTCNTSIPAYKTRKDKIWSDFETACRTADYNRLAELHPYSDGALEIEVSHLPEDQQRMVRAQELRDIFKDAESLDPKAVRFLLRDPEIGFNPEMIHANERRREIFMEIWKASQAMLIELEKSLPTPRQSKGFEISDLYAPLQFSVT